MSETSANKGFVVAMSLFEFFVHTSLYDMFLYEMTGRLHHVTVFQMAMFQDHHGSFSILHAS